MNLDEVFHEGAERDVQMLLACHRRVHEVLTAVWGKCNKALDRVLSCPDSYSGHKNTDGSTRRLMPEQRMMHQPEAQADRVLNVDQIEHRFSLLGIRVSYFTGQIEHHFSLLVSRVPYLGFASPNGYMEIEYNGQSADMSPEYFVEIIDIREFEMLIIENAVKQGRLKPQDLYRAIKCGYPSFNELIEQIA